MAENDSKFTLTVLSEQGIVYYGDCSVLFVPSQKETIAILPHHTPMIMKLGPGKVSMQLDHTTSNITEVQSGIVYVAENDVSVLINL